MYRLAGWAALIATALAIKFLVVDRYFPQAPGNMLIWLPIALALGLLAIGAVSAYALITGRRRGD